MYLNIHVRRNIKKHCIVKSITISNEKLIVFFPALMVTMDPIGSFKFLEKMSRHHETHKKKTLKFVDSDLDA